VNSQFKKYRTQWASQFYVAAELTRRNYLVSLTLGNAPVADLLVVSPSGIQFMVDVKGQSTKNFWLIQNREPRPDLFFVLVYLPKEAEIPKYFILSNKEIMKKRNEYREHIENTSGRYDDKVGGINWTTAFSYEDRWESLPD
jgi:hypothetical protein